MNRFLVAITVLVSVLALQLPAMGQASTEFLDTVYIREQISKYESAGRSRRQPQLSDQEFAEL